MTIVRDHLLIRAIRGDEVERVPVWAMRQAGRWDPEFNKLRAGHSFYEFSQKVDLAAQASLLPQRFGVDAIILFYDITSLTVAMGLPFELQPNVGPAPLRPIRTKADLDQLNGRPDADSYSVILDLLGTVKRQLSGQLPVLVFAGAPFTLASYCIGTGKDIRSTRAFASEHPDLWAGLLEKIAMATIQFLRSLVEAGADAWQLFDSWAGKLTMDEYDRWAHRAHRLIFREVRGVPKILFAKECPYIDAMFSSGADVISLGSEHDLAALHKRFPGVALQGNLSDQLMRKGSPDNIINATQACLAQGGGRRHILNLSHGMNKDTPVENFAAYVATARSFRVA